MHTALSAGAAYFALVFAAGFILGTLRVSFLAEALGELGAVTAELPVMLAISWLACRWLVRRLAVPSAPARRLVMGVSAFALLMGAEIGLSVLVFGKSLAEHAAAWTSAHGALGLAGQVSFALIPLLQHHVRECFPAHSR